MANESDRQHTIDDVIALNAQLQDIMKTQSRALGSVDMDRAAELVKIQNRFNAAIQADGQNMYKAKSASQSVYDYMARSLVGYNDLNQRGIKMSTGDPKRDAWLNKAKLERLFTTSDSQMASYFMSTNSDIAHIYDEIDSICAYFYQLEEAISCIVDNVFSSEQPGNELSYDVKFPGISDTTLIAEYREQVDEAFKYCEFKKKLVNHIGPKAIKYGCYYVLMTPFAEVGAKLAYNGTASISLAALGSGFGTRHLCESTMVEGKEVDVKDELMESCEDLLVSLSEEPIETDKNGDRILPKDIQTRLDIISSNMDRFFVCDDDTPPDVIGLDQTVYESMDQGLQSKVDAAIKAQKARINNTAKLSRVEADNGNSNISAKDLDNIQGCDLRLVDPRQMVPIKIFDYVIGYYYFENYEFTRMGTTLTDIMSNQLNFSQRTLVIDNIVNAALRNLKYKDLVEGDQKLRTMILNCVLYAERRDSPIRVKFVPADYVVAFQTNTDEYGNGQPVLLRSLFYGRLYTSLLLFNMTAIITKSTDSEFYYMRESALDPSYSNQVSDLIDQFNDNNIDLIQIAQGDLLHGNRAINKRYYVPLGTDDRRMFDMEVVSGQQIDIHNDFMTDLRKMTIGSTGVPAVMVDFMDEVEYATMLGMVNIRHLKRANRISLDFDPSITEVIQKILTYNNSSMPKEVIDRMRIELTKSNTLNNNITSQQLGDTNQTATTMVDVYLGGQDTNPPEDQAFIREAMIRDVTIQLSSAVPWNILPEVYDRAVISAKKQNLQQKIRTNVLQNQSTDSSADYGNGDNTSY